MNYITKWYDDLMQRSSLNLPREIRVEGLPKQHVGPRLEFAKIEILAEPSASFDVRFASGLDQNDITRMFLDAAVLGLLDIFLISEAQPLRNVRITVTRCEVDPIDSSEMAFRHAGRDAGEKIINALRSEGR